MRESHPLLSSHLEFFTSIIHPAEIAIQDERRKICSNSLSLIERNLVQSMGFSKAPTQPPTNATKAYSVVMKIFRVAFGGGAEGGGGFFEVNLK